MRRATSNRNGPIGDRYAVHNRMRKTFNWAFGRYFGNNSWYLCVEIFWATIYASAQTFTGAYAIRLGATNSEISLLSSVPALTAVLILLPAGHFLQSRKRRKNWILGSLLVARAGTLLFVILPWLHLGGLSQGTLFVTLLALWTIPAHFFNLGFIPFLAEAVREQNRADVFAARNILSGAMLSLCNFLFGIWLGRIAFPFNYQAMFLIGFAFSLLSVYYLSKVNTSEVPRITVTHAAAPIWESLTRQWPAFVLAVWKVRGFTQIVVNTFLHGVGIWLATPLYLLYFVRTLGASEAWLGVFGSVGALTTILGYIFWRRIINRWGELKTLQWTIVALGLYPLLVGSTPSLTAILLIAGLNGLIAPGVNLSHFNTFLKLIPEDERHNYTSVYLTLMNIGAFVCPIIGVALADRYGFAPVLVACGLLSIIGSTSFWIWPVGESRQSGADLRPEGGRTRLTGSAFFNTMSNRLTFRALSRGAAFERGSRSAGGRFGLVRGSAKKERQAMTTLEMTSPRVYEKYRVSVDQYRLFREQGFLVIKGLVPLEDVREMNDYMDDMLAGRKAIDGAIIMKGFGLKPSAPEEWSRAHMLHRLSPMHERFLLHPRVLDGLEALIGPDVLALQSMLFFKQPGQPGQGYHQDSYYLPSFPDTLCGAWQALTPAAVENGCMWMAVGSHHEPVYPDPNGGGAALSTNIGDLGTIENPSNNDLSINTLSRIVKKYEGKLVPVEADPGDVVFFGGHIVHWSYGNKSAIPRRSFVGHYCNARSLVLWNHGEPWEGDSANYLHILARGDTHLDYAQPKFGTPCAANEPRPKKDSAQATSMMGMEDDMMGPGTHPDEPDPD